MLRSLPERFHAKITDIEESRTLTKFLWHSWLAIWKPMNWVCLGSGYRAKARARAWYWRLKAVILMSFRMMKILKWNPTSLGNSKSSWRMPMQKDLTRTESNLVLHNSRAKIKGRRMLGMAVSALFPPNQSASDVKILDIWHKNVQLISRPLGKAKPCCYFE